LAGDKELKWSFRVVIRCRGREFYNIGIHRRTQMLAKVCWKWRRLRRKIAS
jgi:hypothetical protein